MSRSSRDYEPQLPQGHDHEVDFYGHEVDFHSHEVDFHGRQNVRYMLSAWIYGGSRHWKWFCRKVLLPLGSHQASRYRGSQASRYRGSQGSRYRGTQASRHRGTHAAPLAIVLQAHVRQSRPDSGLGFQVKGRKTVFVVPFSRNGRSTRDQIISLNFASRSILLVSMS